MFLNFLACRCHLLWLHNCLTRDDSCVVFFFLSKCLLVLPSGSSSEALIDCLLVTSSCLSRSNDVFLKLLQAGVSPSHCCSWVLVLTPDRVGALWQLLINLV
jgi:hypothetical protein